MEIPKPIVEKQVIVDLLYGDEEYVSEFASASVESFTEFKIKFAKSMQARDMENLRQAGHKIKPVAQMMKLDAIITMYETSKIMLQEEASDEEINKLVGNMNKFCTQLIQELKAFE